MEQKAGRQLFAATKRTCSLRAQGYVSENEEHRAVKINRLLQKRLYINFTTHI